MIFTYVKTIGSKKLTLEYDSESNEPGNIEGDFQKIKEYVTQNLFKQKYTSEFLRIHNSDQAQSSLIVATTLMAFSRVLRERGVFKFCLSYGSCCVAYGFSRKDLSIPEMSVHYHLSKLGTFTIFTYTNKDTVAVVDSGRNNPISCCLDAIAAAESMTYNSEFDNTISRFKPKCLKATSVA